MAGKSGQKFIKENRAPRVHIEYEVETFGAMQKVELPFVMGVLSDLSGKSKVEKAGVHDRKFEDYDMDNCEQKMAGVAPRAAFNVENTLSGGGKMGVDLTFSSMQDFTPGAVAQNVPALRKLLETRKELHDLMLDMDGKEGAQDLLDRVIKDPDLMRALAAAGGPPAQAAPETDASE